MTTEKHDPWALLAEIHELQPWLSQDADLAARVEAALAGRAEGSTEDVVESEVKRLTTLLAGTEAVLENEREYQARLKAEIGQLANESFRRGAEAMREAAAQRCEVSPIHGEKTTTTQKYADAVRALPIPEDTK